MYSLLSLLGKAQSVRYANQAVWEGHREADRGCGGWEVTAGEPWLGEGCVKRDGGRTFIVLNRNLLAVFICIYRCK